MWFLVAAALCVAFSLAAPVPFDGVVRPWGDGSLGAFLSPPAGGNHASTVVVDDVGTVHAAFFSGGEGQPGCAIAYCSLAVAAPAFTPCRVVSQRANFSAQNPVLYWEQRSMRLHLYHTSQATGSGGGESTSAIWHTSSGDHGLQWEPPAEFFPTPGAFTRNHMVERLDGSLLLPSYWSVVGTDSSFMLTSDAARTAWLPVGCAMSGDLIQPTVVRVTPGDRALRGWFRDEDAIAIYVANSADDGSTWTLPQRTTLPNNNAGIAAAVLASGAVVIVFNDHAGTDTPRSPLVIAISDDGGSTWVAKRALAVHDTNSSAVGEYSYPSVAALPNGSGTGGNSGGAQPTIGVTYTYDRETIVFRAFDEAWVRSGTWFDSKIM